MGNGRAPKDIKDWMILFESSALYRHEPSRLFEDWLEVCICCFANQRMEERYLQIVKRYDRQELDTMAQLMGLLILMHEDHTAGGGWFDGLGQIYEHLASRSKTSRMGQFFTPPEVCDVMARICYDGQEAPPQAYDPCAGSGRLLLAQRAVRKDIDLYVAGDVDPVCVKMCALNFWLHGMRGEVACMNSLSLQWYFAYQTHPRLLWPFITYIGEDRKEESLMYINAQSIMEGAAQKPTTVVPDLFTGVSEPAAPYGKDQDEDDPFRPCDLCGQVRSNACTVIADQVREPWTMRGEQLVCTGCHAPLWNERVAGEREPKAA